MRYRQLNLFYVRIYRFPSLIILRKFEKTKNVNPLIKSIYSSGDFIVDFCAGGGHLGLAAAAHFPESKVAIVDYKGTLSF